MKKISVVIPVFNERENLRELYQRLNAVLPKCALDYELIFVDDGSGDGSFELLKQLSEQDEKLLIIQLARNFGQHSAISAGLSRASGDIAVIMDADLQNPPEEIPKLLKALDQGFDLAYGIRKARKDPWIKKIGSWFADLLLKFLLGSHSNISPFLAVKKPFVDAYNSCPERQKFFTGLFTWLGAQSVGVEVEHCSRKSGRTKYSFWKLLQLVVTMTVSFTEAPLRWASRLGFLVSILGLALFAKIIIQKLFFQVSVPGYASIFAGIVFFGGIQLLFLGILGEYLARIYIESRQRPDYVVRQIVAKPRTNEPK